MSEARLYGDHRGPGLVPIAEPARSLVHVDVDLLASWYGELVPYITTGGWDFATGISGPEGSGKSTLAVHVARITDPSFRIVEQLAFTPADYVRLFKRLPRGRTKVGDEWVKAGYKRRHSTKGNLEVNEAFMTLRGLTGGHHLLIMPDFWDFETYWRNHRLRFWLLVKRRGEAILHTRQKNDYKPGEVFWRQEAVIKYPELVDDEWADYKLMKDAYMEEQAEKAISALDDEENEGGEEDERRSERERMEHLAKEVLANPERWMKGKRVDKARLTLSPENGGLGLSDWQARRVAETVSALRRVA